MFVKKEYSKISNFGTKIQFMLSGTLYFGDKTLSTEYLIFENVLKALGDLYGLELIEYECFEKYYNESFFEMTNEFKVASFLNYTFSFKKI